MSLGRTREHLERDALVALLEELHWNLTAVARRLEISDSALRARIAKHRIERQKPTPKKTEPRRARATRFYKIAPRVWVPETT